jgi:hypothetical protein
MRNLLHEYLVQEIFLCRLYLQNVQSIALSSQKLWVFAGYVNNKRWVLANVLANQTSLFEVQTAYFHVLNLIVIDATLKRDTVWF